MHFDTLSVHAGHFDDQIGSVMSPIHVSTTFERDEAGNIGGKGYIYTRWDNPNRHSLETKLALLEGGEEAFAFPIRHGRRYGTRAKCTGTRYSCDYTR